MTPIADVEDRLASLGYLVSSGDAWLLSFLADKVTRYIQTECNISEIPEGLHTVAIERIAGEFLREKKAVCPEALEGIDLDAAIKQIKEGDTSITYAVGEGSLTPEQRLDALIQHLVTYGRGQFSAYRRVRW